MGKYDNNDPRDFVVSLAGFFGCCLDNHPYPEDRSNSQY